MGNLGGDMTENGRLDENDRVDELVAMRERLEARNAEGLLRLLATRQELRGVYPLADQLGDGVLWSA